MTSIRARRVVKEGERTRAQAREAGAGLGVLLERIQEGSSRRNFEVGRGWCWSRVRGRGKSNASRTTDRFRVTNLTLGTETNAPLAYNTGLELYHLSMSNLGEPRGQLERERERDRCK